MESKKIILWDIQNKKFVQISYSSVVLFDIYESKYKVPEIKELQKLQKDNSLKISKPQKLEKFQKKIKKYISEFEEFIPLYAPIEQKIYLIYRDHVYQRVMYQHYRLPDSKLLESTNDFTTELAKNNRSFNQNFMKNYDLKTLEATYIRVFYYYANEVGKNITKCLRPSFVAELPHIRPYYTRSELINLALNMKLIEPDNTYYDIEKILKLCPEVQSNDLPFKTILDHRDYFIQSKGIHLVQHYTFNGSFRFNKYLRAKQNEMYKDSLLEENIISTWNLCLNSPEFPKDQIVYRFVDNDNYLKHLKIGEIFFDPGFTSTTRDPFYRSNYYSFGFVLIKIHLPKNKKGVALCLESFSHFPEEQEIILPPYTKLKLISKDNNFEFFHIDDNFKSKIIKKYEFELIYENKKPEFEDKYLILKESELHKKINLYEIQLYSVSLEKRIKEFEENFSNKIKQFDVDIGEKTFTLILEWYDSNSAYKNLYAASNKNGFSIYCFHKNTILFFIEIVEPLNEIHVNYYFRKSDSSFLFETIKENDFLQFVSLLAYTFKIQKVVLYSHYKFCFNVSKNNTNRKLFTNISSNNYCSEYYLYLKNKYKRFDDVKEIKNSFDYMQFDKLFSINVKEILSKKDKDEIHQIYTSTFEEKSKTTIADFYVYIVENHCRLIKTFENKISRIFTGISKFLNPFLYDHYVLDPSLYLFNRNMISSLPELNEIDTPESNISVNLIKAEGIEELTEKGIRGRV